MLFHPVKRYSENLPIVVVCVVFFFNLAKLNFPLKCEQYFHSVNGSESLLVDLDDCFSEAESVSLFGI